MNHLNYIITIFFICFVNIYSFAQKDFIVYYGKQKPDEYMFAKIRNNKAILEIFVEAKTFKVEEMTIERIGKHHFLFYDAEKQEAIRQEVLLKGEIKLLTTHKMERLNWEFLEGEKEILGYKCQQAILKKNELMRIGETNIDQMKVWFTPEIPIGVGPYGGYLFYTGLPGLILESSITYTNKDLGVISTTALKIEKQDMPDLRPTEGVWVSPEELEKVKGYSEKKLKAWYKEKQK